MTKNYKEYQNYQEYKDYFKALDALGNHYFKGDSLIYLTIDEEELDDIFNEIRGKEKGIEFLADACKSVLSNERGRPFENIKAIEKSWSLLEEQSYPPQLCFVALFIIAATKMGDDSEKFHPNVYYGHLENLLQTGENTDSYFRRDFGFEDGLFNKLSHWLNEVFGKERNTFINETLNSDRENHRAWVINQTLMNKKDLYQLGTFFKFIGLEPGDKVDYNFLFEKLKDYLSVEDYRSRKFSKALRRNITLDEFKERISNTVSSAFQSWDGYEKTNIDEFRIEFVHLLSFDNQNQSVLDLKGTMNLNRINTEISDEFSLDSKTETLTVKKNLFTGQYETNNINNIYFGSFTWKLNSDDSNLRIRVTTYDKQIMLFTYIKNDIFIGSTWREYENNQVIDENEIYMVVCTQELIEDVNKYLIENSENSDSVECLKYAVENSDQQVYVFKDIKFKVNRQSSISNPYLDIFSVQSQRRNRLTLQGGLELERQVYLNSGLPSIKIPEEYLKDNKLSINLDGREAVFEFDDNNLLLTPNDYMQYFDDEPTTFTFTYDFDNRYLDILEFSSRFDYGLINNPNAGTFGYEISSDTFGNLEIKDVVAKKIDASNGLRVDFVSGGELNTKHPILRDNLISEITYEQTDNKITLIGRNSNIVQIFTNEPVNINWIDEFKKAKTLFIFDTSKNNLFETKIEQVDFMPFLILKKLVKIPNLTWVATFGIRTTIENFSNKSPKGFESKEERDITNEILWAKEIHNLNELIKLNDLSFELENLENNNLLWKEYVKKSNEILKKNV